jgi:peptide chain release factor 1
MIERLEKIYNHYNEINNQLSQPDIFENKENFKTLSKEQKDLTEIVNAYQIYKDILKQIEGVKQLLAEEKDRELTEIAEQELKELQQRQSDLEEKLKILLIPKDPHDSKNVIVEIRAGTGGDEACLFAADLFKMYIKYAERKNLAVEIMNSHAQEGGGFKEVIFSLNGENAYSLLKYEGGVHRVQRVPKTEASGRIHTSAASVAVMPEAEEVDIVIDPKDIRLDVYRSSGPGGQSVNTTDSAVRLTHIPTGMVVTCQDEKSQHKNRAKAMKVLRSRLYDQKMAEERAKQEAARRSMVSTGDRSAKIRTYNFPQQRVTDHRINFSLYALDDILAGNVDPLIEQLQIADRTEKLKFDNEN